MLYIPICGVFILYTLSTTVYYYYEYYFYEPYFYECGRRSVRDTYTFVVRSPTATGGGVLNGQFELHQQVCEKSWVECSLGRSVAP